MYSVHEQIAEEKMVKPIPRNNGVMIISQMILVLALAVGTFLRIWQINAMGYNSDEAVYSGQAAAIAGVPVLKDIFPIFRAHPLLFQFLLSLIYKIQFNDLFGRLLAVGIGICTILLTYQIGKILYGRIPGALAATFLALMPYHIVVSRQVLLDGPMTFFATLTLYMLARFGRTQRCSLAVCGRCVDGFDFFIERNQHRHVRRNFCLSGAGFRAAHAHTRSNRGRRADGGGHRALPDCADRRRWEVDRAKFLDLAVIPAPKPRVVILLYNHTPWRLGSW